MGVINVIDHEGTAHKLEAVEGWRVMEIIREHGLPMDGLCGGACACATCHVYVDDNWQAKLHEPRDDEDAMLDEVPTVFFLYLISCKVIYTPELDGLAVKLDAELAKARAA